MTAIPEVVKHGGTVFPLFVRWCSSLSLKRTTKRRRSLVELFRACSNRAASRVNVLKTQEKYCAENIPILQEFCKRRKSSAKRLASLTRKRSVVRIHYRPLTVNREVRKFESCRERYSFSPVCSRNAEEKRADTSTGSFHMWLAAPLTKAAIVVAPIN
jgi:hypothetical protein